MKRIAFRTQVFAVLLILFTALVGGGLYLYSYEYQEAGPFAWHAYERVGFPDVKAELGEARGENARARMEHELRRLQDPQTGVIPSDIRRRELAKAASLPQRHQYVSKNSALNRATWTGRGPVNVGGRTRALAIDLDFNGTSNRKILAGGVSGGMFMSEDDGASWRLTTSPADLASVTALAQDPTSRNVWYYGTGELLGNSASNGGTSFLGQGIFKSTDGGANWSQLPATAEGAVNTFDNIFDRVWNIAVDPTNGNVFAAVFGFIMRSTDGGQNWFAILGPQEQPFGFATDVAIASDGTVYATLSRNGNTGITLFGVFQSQDGGDSWIEITPPEMGNDPWRQVLGISPSNPDIVYLLAQSNEQGNDAADHQFFRFNASTNTWTNLSQNLPDVSVPDQSGNPPLEGTASLSSQGGYNMLVRVKPDDPNVVWVGGTNLYRSVDGGASFERVGGYASPYSFALYPRHHVDQHAMSFYPNNPSAMISGNDGGLFRTLNVLESPQSWNSLNNGYLTTQFYAVAIDPEPGSDFLVGGLQDNGTWSTTSTNPDITWSREFSGDGGFAAVAPGGLPYYVSSQLGFILRASVADNNIIGSVVGPAGGQNFLFIAPYLLDPNDARVMYLAEGNRVWRNSNLDGIPPGNGSETQINWTALTGSVDPSIAFVTALGVSKSPANRLYFGGTDFQLNTRIIRVDNPEANGPGVNITPPGITSGSFPSSIAVNPDNGDEVVVTFSNYNIPSIWHTTDGGATWTDIEGNLSGDDGPSVAWGLVMPTAGGTTYFLATSTGVYSTELLSGANTVWVQEGAQVIGNVDTDMLIGRPEDGLVIAATHGRGVFSATLDGTTGSGVLASVQNEVNIEALPGEVATGTLEIQNTGSVKLRYTVSFTELGKNARESSANTLERKISLANQPSVKRPRLAGDERIGWRAGAAPASDVAPPIQPYSTAGDDVLIYDDGNDVPDDFWGFVEGGIALFWGNEFLADGADFILDGFDFYMRTESVLSNDVMLTVYDDAGEILENGTLTFNTASNGGWYGVFIDPPITIPAGETFFIEIGADESINFPAGIDRSGQVTGRSLFRSETSAYANLTETSGSGFEQGAFLVRATGTIGSQQNQPPEVSATVTTFEAAVGEEITFDASASTDSDGSIVSYIWDFGDGNQSAQAVATHAYSSPGTYTAVVTVTDDDGASSSASGDITVTGTANQPPLAVINTSTTSADVNEAITFDASQSTDADGSILTYLWNFGNGVEDVNQVASHSYAAPGSYAVTLTVTDDDGATGQTSSQIVVNSSQARLAVTPASGTLAPGASALLDVSFNTAGLPENTYQGVIEISSVAGTIAVPVSVLVSRTVSVEEESTLVSALRLNPNYPNPFSSETVIQYELPGDASVSLDIFDLNGRRIRSINHGARTSGVHEMSWNTLDDAGKPVVSGLYLYRLIVNEQSGGIAYKTGSMTLVR